MEHDYKHKLMGMAITKTRKDLKVKAKDIAVAVNVTAAAISKIETGQLRTTAIMLFDIAQALGVSAKDIEATYLMLLGKYNEVIVKVELDYLALGIVHSLFFKEKYYHG